MPSRAELVNRANVVGFDPTTIPNDSKLEQHIIYLETNAATMAGTLAVGTLTQSGPAAAGDQVLIGTAAQGGITYTFVTALTGVKATGLITSDATAPDDGDTVTIEGKTYTFKTTLSSPAQANQVLIGISAAVALDNLKKAINDSGTEGTHYSTDTVAHSLVTADANTDTTQVVTAKIFGTAPNFYSLAETSAHLAWGSAKMGTVVTSEVAGVANVVNELKLTGVAETELNLLKDAINNTELLDSNLEGTNYSWGTRAHPLVTATTNGATTQVVAARDMAVGEDLSTTDPVDGGSVLSWGATTLASGVADQNAVNAVAKAQTSGGKNMNV